MTKRRTSGIQRRSRASTEAMTRRVGEGGSPIDWRILLIGGVLGLGAVVVLVLLLFGGGGGGPAVGVGVRQADDGRGHIADGVAGGPYSSTPATSGTHWATPTNWGIYSTALPEELVLHNLEHGGLVIWYQPTALADGDLAALTAYVQTQVASERFKVILTPWGGSDFGHPIAVTSWNWLLYLDTADIDQVRAFLDDHYGEAPEPLAGPGRPGG
ncbi:MAG TPA: DUF3105 domain-containing protein [Candidatus Limnocylindria bacterium]